jgi:hypothetical protein
MHEKSSAYFPKQLDAQEVQNDDKHSEYGDPCRRWDWCIPKLQDSRRSAHISRYHYGHCVPWKQTSQLCTRKCSSRRLAARSSGGQRRKREHDPSSQSRRTKVPPNSSPQRRLNEMRSMADKPSRPRHESRDLAGSVRDAQSDQAHESISQQSARRACNRENFAGSEEETGSLSCVRCLGWLMAVAGFF